MGTSSRNLMGEKGNTPDQNSDNNSENEKIGTVRQIEGAAVAGGIIGLMMRGPLVGIAAAGGAVYLAQTDKGELGNIARDSGDICSNIITTTCDKVKMLEKSVGEKKNILEIKTNRIVGKTTDNAKKGLHKIRKNVVGPISRKVSTKRYCNQHFQEQVIL